MTTPVLICDDSSVARKQMARTLPSDWDIEVSFAKHGEEAIAAIKEGLGDILFLDLNMPVMDGYQTLEEIKRLDLPTLVIVVSGDIQPEAHKRVKDLGAVEFIKKPTSKEALVELLEKFGLYSPSAQSASSSPTETTSARANSAKIEPYSLSMLPSALFTVPCDGSRVLSPSNDP